MPQPQSRQQSQFNEIQMLQRQIMFKQLQELQRQKKLQELNDARQQNVINQQSLIHNNKPASGGQYSPFINGTPVRDASQMFMFGNTNLVQGFPNGLVYSQAQNQVLHSMSPASQQHDGTPISSTGNSFSQYSHFQGLSHEPTGSLTKHSGEQAEKAVAQPSISKSFLSDQFNVSSNQERNLFGPGFTQGSDLGGQTGNIQQVDNHQKNASLQQFGGGQEQGDWSGRFSEKPANTCTSQGSATLDPLEQKILFSMDDNSWGASFGKHGNVGTGGFGNMFENTDHSSTFPSVQSGIWSALMQSAVAEASSSDTGLQEEWSGLSFQNPEHSNDNQPSNFVESGKHPTPLLDNHLQNASTLNTSNASLSFPGFQHYAAAPFQVPKKEDVRADSSHESIRHSPKEAGERSEISPQQREHFEGNAPVHRISALQSAWPGKNYENLQSDSSKQSMSACNNNIQSLEYVNHSDRRSETMRDDHPHPCNSPVSEGIQKPSGQVSQGRSSYEQGHSGEFGFVNNGSNNGRDFKGFLPDIQRNFRGSEEADFRSSDCSSMSALLGTSASTPAPNSTAQTSHNMLELLHKVDKLREYRPGTPTGYTDSAPTTVVPKAEHADASASSPNHSSASQYFGLRLSPPTQRPLVTNYFDTAQISQQSGHPTGILPGAQYDNNQLQNQNSPANHSPQTTASASEGRYPSFGHDVSQEPSHRLPMDQDGQHFSTHTAKQVRQTLVTSGMAQQVAFSTRPPNVWIDVPAQQNLVASGSPSTSDAANSRMEAASEAPKELYYQKSIKGENDILETGANVLNSQGFDHGRRQAGKIFSAEEPLSGHSEANASSPSSLMQGSGRVLHSGMQAPSVSARDLEAFGRSLKQAHVPQHNYSLLNPVHSDPSVSAAIKHERADSDIKLSQVTSVSQLNSYGNFRTLPVSSAGDQLVKSSSQLPLQDSSQDTVAYSKDGFHSQFVSNNAASNLTGRSQMNFQVPPSWFKAGQMLPMHVSQQLSVGRPYESLHTKSSLQVNLAGAIQHGSIWPASGTTSVDVTHLSSPYLLHSEVPNQNLVNLKPKKRKFSTLELLPWHKEVTEGSPRLQDTSTNELEWAQAVNRLPEKLIEEALGDSHHIVNRKKRLTLTTQLMQLLFRPAPSVILSKDATRDYDTVIYFAARLALGDACSLAKHSHMPRDVTDSLSGKSIASKNSGDISKVVEDFIVISKRLEDELSRLENGGSILDVTMESQEIDKFAMINRFARFHCRAQLAAAAEAAASGGTPTVPKFYPQRYVTATPMPKTVPEEQHCLSL